MVHFPGFARARLWIHRAVRRFYQRGFPHSEIPGSMPACGSPRLIAACHVLHRLLLPRHPPCALSSLTTKFTRYTQEAPYCQPSAFSQKFSNAPSNFMGLIPAHRTLTPSPAFFCDSLVKAFDLLPESTRTQSPRPVHQQVLSGTHKNYVRLVNCPIYSVVKYRPRELAST